MWLRCSLSFRSLASRMVLKEERNERMQQECLIEEELEAAVVVFPETKTMVFSGTSSGTTSHDSSANEASAPCVAQTRLSPADGSCSDSSPQQRIADIISFPGPASCLLDRHRPDTSIDFAFTPITLADDSSDGKDKMPLGVSGRIGHSVMDDLIDACSFLWQRWLARRRSVSSREEPMEANVAAGEAFKHHRRQWGASAAPPAIPGGQHGVIGGQRLRWNTVKLEWEAAEAANGKENRSCSNGLPSSGGDRASQTQTYGSADDANPGSALELGLGSEQAGDAVDIVERGSDRGSDCSESPDRDSSYSSKLGRWASAYL